MEKWPIFTKVLNLCFCNQKNAQKQVMTFLKMKIILLHLYQSILVHLICYVVSNYLIYLID